MGTKKEKHVTISLLDKENLFIKILQDKFETSSQFQIRTYSDAEIFFKEFSMPVFLHNHHIVLLDHLMKAEGEQKAENGIELLKIIKKMNPDADIILLSNEDNIGESKLAIQNGAISYIKKNENAFLRIHNCIKCLVSEKKLLKKKKSSRRIMVLFFLAVSILLVASVILYLNGHLTF